MKVWIYYNDQNTRNSPFGGFFVQNIIDEFKTQGYELANRPEDDCEFHLSLQMGNCKKLSDIAKSRAVPFYTYVWDFYEWAYKDRPQYDWAEYGKLCHLSNKVFTPSSGQRTRMLQNWRLPLYKSSVVLPYAPFWEYEKVEDKNYVCNPLRHYKSDKNYGWIEQICKELKIPYKSNNRDTGDIGLEWKEYQQFIAESSFLVCPWWEMSTGGMSLYEAYYIGKEVLFCDSPYVGGKDSFGNRAHYFYPSYESLKNKIEDMWDKKESFPTKNLKDKQDWCLSNFSVTNFVKRITKEIIGA